MNLKKVIFVILIFLVLIFGFCINSFAAGDEGAGSGTDKVPSGLESAEEIYEYFFYGLGDDDSQEDYDTKVSNLNLDTNIISEWKTTLETYGESNKVKIQVASEVSGSAISNGSYVNANSVTCQVEDEPTAYQKIYKALGGNLIDMRNTAELTRENYGASTLSNNYNKYYKLGKEENNEDVDLDTVIDNGSKLVEEVDADKQVNVSLTDLWNPIYNILITIATVVAVGAGLALGIRFMTASVEGKAQVKQLLTPYIVGCVIVFGAFGIWKLAVTILSQI